MIRKSELSKEFKDYIIDRIKPIEGVELGEYSDCPHAPGGSIGFKFKGKEHSALVICGEDEPRVFRALMAKEIKSICSNIGESNDHT